MFTNWIGGHGFFLLLISINGNFANLFKSSIQYPLLCEEIILLHAKIYIKNLFKIMYPLLCKKMALHSLENKKYILYHSGSN